MSSLGQENQNFHFAPTRTIECAIELKSVPNFLLNALVPFHLLHALG